MSCELCIIQGQCHEYLGSQVKLLQSRADLHFWKGGYKFLIYNYIDDFYAENLG